MGPAEEGTYSDGGEDLPYGSDMAGGTALARSPAPAALAAEGGGAGDGPPEKKRRRRKRKLDAPTVAHFMRLQQGRGPVRKWVQKWVSVPAIVGGGDTMMLKWVTDQPLATAAGPSLDQLTEMDTLPPLDDGAAGAASGGGGGGGTPSGSRGLPPLPPGGHEVAQERAGGHLDRAQQQQQQHQQQHQHQQQPKEEQVHEGTPGVSSVPATSVASAPPGGSAVAVGPEAAGAQQGGIRGAVAAMAAAAAAAAAAKASPGPGGAAAAASAGKFVCPQCGKVVNSEGGLKKHMLIHGEKNFLCPHPGCGKGFTDQGKLNKHMVVHETEKRWKCPLCTKPFVGEAYLKSHWKKSHKDVPMPAFAESAPAGGGGEPAGAGG